VAALAAYGPSLKSRLCERLPLSQEGIMGKRSDFERVPRDFYPTPYEAVVPLLPHLAPGTRYAEPCAGDGALIKHLALHGHICAAAADIEPRANGIIQLDARKHTLHSGYFYITNPPWERETLHPIILNLSRNMPTWLLFDADWMHTKQSAPFMPFLHKIVSVGRVKWIPDSKMTGKDNCCWYLFDQTSEASAQFIGRAA
jgi:hypothetical protein